MFIQLATTVIIGTINLSICDIVTNTVNPI